MSKVVTADDVKFFESVLHELVTTDGLHATDKTDIIPVSTNAPA